MNFPVVTDEDDDLLASPPLLESPSSSVPAGEELLPALKGAGEHKIVDGEGKTGCQSCFT